jgi:hypothetical protein
VPYHALVRDPVLDELYQPPVVDGLEQWGQTFIFEAVGSRLYSWRQAPHDQRSCHPHRPSLETPTVKT